MLLFYLYCNGIVILIFLRALTDVNYNYELIIILGSSDEASIKCKTPGVLLLERGANSVLLFERVTFYTLLLFIGKCVLFLN